MKRSPCLQEIPSSEGLDEIREELERRRLKLIELAQRAFLFRECRGLDDFC